MWLWTAQGALFNQRASGSGLHEIAGASLPQTRECSFVVPSCLESSLRIITTELQDGWLAGGVLHTTSLARVFSIVLRPPTTRQAKLPDENPAASSFYQHPTSAISLIKRHRTEHQRQHNQITGGRHALVIRRPRGHLRASTACAYGRGPGSYEWWGNQPNWQHQAGHREQLQAEAQWH